MAIIYIPDHYINTDQIIEVITYQAHEGGWDEHYEEHVHPRPFRAEILTTGTVSEWQDTSHFTGNPDSGYSNLKPYEINLVADEAKWFIEQYRSLTGV